MRIFIAGATGTLGIPLVREMAARGHEVTGYSSNFCIDCGPGIRCNRNFDVKVKN